MDHIMIDIFRGPFESFLSLLLSYSTQNKRDFKWFGTNFKVYINCTETVGGLHLHCAFHRSSLPISYNFASAYLIEFYFVVQSFNILIQNDISRI